MQKHSLRTPKQHSLGLFSPHRPLFPTHYRVFNSTTFSSIFGVFLWRFSSHSKTLCKLSFFRVLGQFSEMNGQGNEVKIKKIFVICHQWFKVHKFFVCFSLKKCLIRECSGARTSLIDYFLPSLSWLLSFSVCQQPQNGGKSCIDHNS